MLEIYYPKTILGFSEEDIEKYKMKKFTLHTTNIVSSICNGLLDRECIEEYEEYVEERLVVAGKLFDGGQYLMISESGKLFSEYGFWGNNPEEFWDKILSGGNFTEWAKWDE